MGASSRTYRLGEKLRDGQRTSVYRAARSADGRRILLKVLEPGAFNAEDLDRLRHEFELKGILQGLPAVEPLALSTLDGSPALELADVAGPPLDQLVGTPFPIDDFLSLAINLAAAVAAIHERGLIHKDLKPSNVFFDRQTKQVNIAEFGIASRFAREPMAARPTRLIEGSLPYVSPEQTGRMNRAVDSRSDLYSLGVIFYQLLTGKLPFDAVDAVGWVHSHVARIPTPPIEMRPALPAMLSDIVLKLLAKVPDERYQSAAGLRFDLERCVEQWGATGRIPSFTLGGHDASDRFLIPQKLYGREAECAALQAAFDRVMASARPDFLLVSGYSGVGKSSVVHELRRAIAGRHGSFLSGKFEEYQRDIPYFTFSQAFRELILDILTESTAKIARWRQRIEAALGPNGRLVIDLIPEVAFIIGPQPPVPELGLTEAENRLHLVLRQFFGVFTDRDHPLTVFLDDLQWADATSLKLLADLVKGDDCRHLLLVGAYRDNEVSASHPLRHTLEELRKSGAAIHDIVIGPLSEGDMKLLVADTVHCSPSEAAPLAHLVRHKTAGNPFFAIQFLTELYRQGLITFDRAADRWSWDIDLIRAQHHTDNVVDLMVGKLRELPCETQDALELAACLGTGVDAPTMTIVLGRDPERALGPALEEELMLRIDKAYRFPHDRVQEAAYALIPQGDRAKMHLKIGRLLWSRTASAELGPKSFEIVNQLNRGAPLIETSEERERVAELNFAAGKRAKDSAAHASALKYLVAGAALLPEDAWERRYDLAFGLEFHRAECEFAGGDLAAAERRLSALFGRAKSSVDLAAVTCAQVALYASDRSDRAIEVSLDYLWGVGLDWSAHPTDAEVVEEFDRLWQRLAGRSIESLVDLPPVSEPALRATMDVLTWASSPAVFTDANLHCLVIARLASLSLAHGNSDGSCVAYVRLGMVMGPRFGDYRVGFELGKLGLDLVERRGLLRFKALVYLDFGALINPWTKQVSTGVGLVRSAFDAAREVGNLTYASYSLNCLITLLLAKGESLGDVQRETESALRFARQAKFDLVIDHLTAQLRLVRLLRGLLPDFGSFDEAEFHEARFERHLEESPHLSIAICWYWIRKLQGRFYAGDYAGALQAAARAEPLLWTSPSFFETAEYHFFRALALAAHCDNASAEDRACQLETIRAHHELLETWACASPENFGHRAALVAAEVARIEKRDLDADRLYADSIRKARDQGFVHHEALAYETAARFYFERRLGSAEEHLRDAIDRYFSWGALGKVRQLERLHPELSRQKPMPPAATLVIPSDQLDLLSVIKASQVISSVIVRDDLLRTLLRVVLEQSGARRAHLVLSREGELEFAAEATSDGAERSSDQGDRQTGETSSRVPLSILHYAARTEERVLFDDAAVNAGRFASDEYLARARPRSILCLPIRRQAHVVALLYLENDLVPGVFTPDRLQALELIAAQAAISLENALLLEREHRGRVEAEAAGRRALILGEATALMSSTFDYEGVFGALTRLCVRSLADWAIIDLVEDGRAVRLAAAHRDPANEPLMRELTERYPLRLGASTPSNGVLQSAMPRYLPDLTDEQRRAICTDERHSEIIRMLGTRSVIIVPLVAREVPLGTLRLASGSPHHFTSADIDLAVEIGRRAALAIDNARLLRETQRAVRLRDDFLSVASHELRTPMTSLSLRIDLLLRAVAAGRPISNEALEWALARISRSSNRLERLIEELLDVTRIEQGKMTLSRGQVDLATLVRGVAEHFELDLTSARCTLSLESDAEVTGHWDARRLEQVVSNLLANAIKFGAGHPIEVGIRDAGGMAELTVGDHGIGIDPARLPHVFDRFERAVSNLHYGGLGLGLYVARSIVEAHGGTIRVASQPGMGSEFTVTLPWLAPDMTGS